MSDGPVITFPAAIFESDAFLVLTLFDDFSRDGRAFDQRRAVGQVFTVAMEQDIREDTFFANFSIKEVDIDDVSFCDAMLSAAGFDNCVSHGLGKVGKSHTEPLL